MRVLPFAVAAALLAGPAAAESFAQPARPHVVVSLGPDLQKKAREDYGLREVGALAAELQAEVDRALSRTGVLAGARVELVLVDAAPNRPTFKQLVDRPGLSLSSHGLGGAVIEGRAVSIDGFVTPLRFAWREADVRRSHGQDTWSDARWAFGRFATRLSRGQTLASR